MVWGVSCPSCSTVSVNLGSITVAKLDSSNNATAHRTLLYFATNLDVSVTHTLILDTQGYGFLVINEFTVNGPKGGIVFE